MEHPEHPEHQEHGEVSPDEVQVDEKVADSRLSTQEAIRKPKGPDDRKGNMGPPKKSGASNDSNNEEDGQEETPETSSEEDTPDTSDNEEPEDGKEQKDGGGDVEGVNTTAPRSNEGTTRERVPDAKGYNKKRINSDNAKVLGEAKAEENMPDKDDKARKSVIKRLESR